MGTHLIRCLCKYLLDDLQIQQVVVTTADNHAKTSGENIDQWSCVAVESVQAKKHLSQGKRKLCRIAGDHLDGTQQFPSVIAIAWPTKGSQLCGIETDLSRVIDWIISFLMVSLHLLPPFQFSKTPFEFADF